MAYTATLHCLWWLILSSDACGTPREQLVIAEAPVLDCHQATFSTTFRACTYMQILTKCMYMLNSSFDGVEGVSLGVKALVAGTGVLYYYLYYCGVKPLGGKLGVSEDT
ncbi:hypothetical protein B0J17DRAFT_634357 [Rhizoctonia solani]|nr:hypothetical protein B0J17DRAFT_634357 [Rhizoctonia solani]